MGPFRTKQKHEILVGGKVKKHPFIIKKAAFCLLLFAIFFQNTEPRCATYEADDVPWSGYWWPTIHGGLVTGIDYRGHPAPLEKYDYVISGTYDGPAASYGWEHHYDKEAPLWEGLCFCWAAASILEEEPVHKGVYKGTVFKVGDKKGLLVAAYLGTLFNEHPIDTPEAFHQILEEFIARQKTPIIMDLGTGGESWNYPVFKYDTDYTQEGNTRHYTTTTYHASDFVRADFVGSQVVEDTFHYYLTFDNDGNITESGWENETVPPLIAREPFGTEPANPGLDYDQVMEIVNTVDDPYEPNDTFESALSLPNGRHTLLALNSDYFKAELRAGNRLNIQVAVEEDRHYATERPDIWLRTYTPEGDLIQEILGGEAEQTLTSDKDGIYFFEITPVKADEEPVYELTLQHHLNHQGIFPIHPAGQWATGIALLNPQALHPSDFILHPSSFRFHPSDFILQISSFRFHPSSFTLTLMDQTGIPQAVHTETPSPCHLIGMLGDDLGLFPSTRGTDYIRIDSDTPFWGLQSATASQFDLLMGSDVIPLDTASAELFFPYFDNRGEWETIFGIINTGDQAEEIFRQSFDEAGQVLMTESLLLGPGEKVEEETSFMAILTSGARTMSAAASSGRDCLTGYTEFQNVSDYKGRALVPLTMGERGTLVVPHTASDDYWRTSIVVMNTGDLAAPVTLSAYGIEGDRISLSEHLLNARQHLAEEVSDIFPEIPGIEIASVKIKSGQPLSGVLLYGTTDGRQLAGMPITSAAASSLYLPHIASTETWWTGIGVMNAGDEPTDISLSLFDDTGTILQVMSDHLNPNQRLVGLMKGLFDTESLSSARYMSVSSTNDQPLSGIYLMGATDKLRLMGGQLAPVH